jgi:hypothetical protein
MAHDFGTVNQGEIITYEFRVKNQGNEPVYVSTVNSSSGCLYFVWPKEPIMPKKTAVIKTNMLTAGRVGTFNKTGYVKFAGIEQHYNLIVKGVIATRPDSIAGPQPSQR